MCGIAGYVGFDTAAHGRGVLAMSDAIVHRGPDDAGLWSDDHVILVHRRLSIIDTTVAGHQPMVSNCGRFVLTYNGEIYNYLELRSDLQRKGHVFRSNSDSEVLLAAFVEWGESCVSRFNGMWAFAIWDRQSHRLFVSRDRFGEKPFYYVQRQGAFWFASEIKALLAAGAVERAVNPRAVGDFAADRVSDHTDQTFFKGVLQIPPATSGWLNEGRLVLKAYWQLPADEATAGPNLVEEIGELLQDAVRLRLRSDVPVGVLLSGGLDSSGVTCLAAEFAQGPIAAFSTIDRLPPEEAAGIDAVLDMHPNLSLNQDQPGDDSLDRELDACLWHQEEPFADGSMIAHFRLMRMAREKGVRVLLTGQAADEVFAGYPGFLSIYLGSLLRSGKLAEAASFFLRVRAGGQSLPFSGVFGHALPAAVAGWLRKMRGRDGLDWLQKDWRAGSGDILAGYANAQGDALNSALRACLSQRTLPGFLHYEDRNSMAFGVETRIPFLDHRLVEKVLPLPAAAKLAGGRSKALLRDALAGRVPRTIVSRLAKQGYPAPLARWLRAASPDQKQLRLQAVAACPIIGFQHWQQHHTRFLAGDDAALIPVWRGLSLALWYKKFIHGGDL